MLRTVALAGLAILLATTARAQQTPPPDSSSAAPPSVVRIAPDSARPSTAAPDAATLWPERVPSLSPRSHVLRRQVEVRALDGGATGLGAGVLVYAMCVSLGGRRCGMAALLAPPAGAAIGAAMGVLEHITGLPLH